MASPFLLVLALSWRSIRVSLCCLWILQDLIALLITMILHTIILRIITSLDPVHNPTEIITTDQDTVRVFMTPFRMVILKASLKIICRSHYFIQFQDITPRPFHHSLAATMMIAQTHKNVVTWKLVIMRSWWSADIPHGIPGCWGQLTVKMINFTFYIYRKYKYEISINAI